MNSETLEFLRQTEWDCLCAACLASFDALLTSIRDESFPATNELKEGHHYYIENGLWVFTERYHLLRGHCCNNGCRHCAYGFKSEIKT